MIPDLLICKLCDEKDMITPFHIEKVQPCSYDLSLKPELRVYERSSVPYSPTEGRKETIKNDKMILYPHEFALATTIETVKLPNNIAGTIVGKSSIGRLGLFIHNAGHIDPGFKGQITLELYNSANYPIDLTDINSICQIVFTEVNPTPMKSYRGKYQNQTDITESREFQEYEKRF